MNVFPTLGWLRLKAFLHPVDQIVCLSWLLLPVIAVQFITMPVTQDLWSWDKFLHGGQDFEIGLLMIVTCLCLTLLRAEQSRCDLDLLFAIRALLLSKRTRDVSLLPYSPRRREHRPRIPSDSCMESLNLPLLI